MEVIKEINGVKTRLLLWGNPFSCDGSDVIICITGNPGIIDFYTEFSSELHKSTGLPVCLIGHAGHDIIFDEKCGDWKGQESLYGLEGQIDHKLSLINDFIDSKSKLHLIGHSIGAWFIIESLQKKPVIIKRVSSINLLFPTLQGMEATNNGKHLRRLLKFYNFVIFFLTLLNMLPKCILNSMANIYLKIKGLPTQYTGRILKYCDCNIMEKVLFLATAELDKVTALNTRTIDNVKDLTNVIYGESDGWVPLKYMEDLRQFAPPLQLNKVPYSHEFVLKCSEQVAEMVSDFIKSQIKIGN